MGRMKKMLLIALLGIVCMEKVAAQTGDTGANMKAYKIVFQLTSGDTNVHKALVKQIGNALTAAPNSTIEVVCHSNGIPFLLTAQTRQLAMIKELKAKGVVFAACENTLRERKIDKSEVVGEAIFVPSGVIEVVDKEMLGWAYLKAGF